jgi:DNA-binding transcriptional MerR regulator
MSNLKTLDEVSRELGIPRRTLQTWLVLRKITPYKIEGDRRRYLDVDEVRRLREPRPLR